MHVRVRRQGQRRALRRMRGVLWSAVERVAPFARAQTGPARLALGSSAPAHLHSTACGGSPPRDRMGLGAQSPDRQRAALCHFGQCTTPRVASEFELSLSRSLFSLPFAPKSHTRATRATAHSLWGTSRAGRGTAVVFAPRSPPLCMPWGLPVLALSTARSLQSDCLRSSTHALLASSWLFSLASRVVA